MPETSEVVDILSSLALFADLPRPKLEAVAHTFDEEWFEADQRILRQGFTGGNFYVILDGEATVRIDGRTRSTLARGDFFGEISILLGEPPSADVVAIRALRCLVLPGPELHEFLTAHPPVMYRMLQAQARRLRSTAEWLE